MTNPDWFINFIKISKHFADIFSCFSSKLYVLFFINMLDIHKKNICYLHQTFKLCKPGFIFFTCIWTFTITEGSPGSIYTCIYTKLFKTGKKFNQEINLKKRLATTYGNSTFCTPIFLAGHCFGNEFLYCIKLSICHFPGIRIMTVKTS